MRWTSWWGARTDDQAREVLDSVDDKRRRAPSWAGRIGGWLWLLIAAVVAVAVLVRIASG